MFISRWSSTIQFSPLPHFRYAYSVLLQFLAFWYSHGCYHVWEWHLWSLCVGSLLLKASKLDFVQDKSWWWLWWKMMSLLVDDTTWIWLLCGGWVYYIKLVVYISAMMKISYMEYWYLRNLILWLTLVVE